MGGISGGFLFRRAPSFHRGPLDDYPPGLVVLFGGILDWLVLFEGNPAHAGPLAVEKAGCLTVQVDGLAVLVAEYVKFVHFFLAA